MVSSEMELQGLLRGNITQALEDYGAYVSGRCVLEDVSDSFIDRLASDAVTAKHDLRELLRKSPAWNETLQAVVINGTRTHDPDFGRIYKMGIQILAPWVDSQPDDRAKDLAYGAVSFFANPKASSDEVGYYLSCINQLATSAYRPRRKKSRIFKAICDELGVTDECAGSEFSRLFAQLADELNGRKLNFKLFLSINPAHFLTMSNPKHDRRGSMLTSCHSFNNTEYSYNCGCSGYARDDVTMIAFTVNDPDDEKTLNNRKTSRQLFMYKVGNGLLLQSRMYDTGGGTRGAQKDSQLYRDLVQRELSELEGVPNRWKTYTYCENRPEGTTIHRGCGFGGYPDWKYSEFDAKISIRLDHKDDFKAFDVGTYGLCVQCADEIKEYMYCDNCRHRACCEDCGEYFDEDDLHIVHNRYGDEIYVCSDCREGNYTYCSHCEEYYPYGTLTEVDGEEVCDNCLSEFYERCIECDSYHRRVDMCAAYNQSVEGYVCDQCYNDYYARCEDCNDVYDRSLIVDGLCPNCRTENNEE